MDHGMLQYFMSLGVELSTFTPSCLSEFSQYDKLTVYPPPFPGCAVRLILLAVMYIIKYAIWFAI